MCGVGEGEGDEGVGERGGMRGRVGGGGVERGEERVGVGGKK